MTGTDRFPERIVVGVDGSDGAARALQWAAALAGRAGASVLAVHVLTYNHALLRDLTPDTMHTWRRSLEHELKGRWIKPLSTTGVAHRTMLVDADSPADGLMEVGEREHADLLVVGSRGHGTITGRVLGSTSYRLTHQARRPVVVVPADWSHAAHPEVA